MVAHRRINMFADIYETETIQMSNRSKKTNDAKTKPVITHAIRCLEPQIIRPDDWYFDATGCSLANSRYFPSAGAHFCPIPLHWMRARHANGRLFKVKLVATNSIRHRIHLLGEKRIKFKFRIMYMMPRHRGPMRAPRQMSIEPIKAPLRSACDTTYGYTSLLEKNYLRLIFVSFHWCTTPNINIKLCLFWNAARTVESHQEKTAYSIRFD